MEERLKIFLTSTNGLGGKTSFSVMMSGMQELIIKIFLLILRSRLVGLRQSISQIILG